MTRPTRRQTQALAAKVFYRRELYPYAFFSLRLRCSLKVRNVGVVFSSLARPLRMSSSASPALFWFKLALALCRDETMLERAPTLHSAVPRLLRRRFGRLKGVDRHPRFRGTAAVYTLLRDLGFRRKQTARDLLQQQKVKALRRRYAYAPPAVQSHVPFRYRRLISHFAYWYGRKFVEPVLEPLVPLFTHLEEASLLSALRNKQTRVYPARRQRGDAAAGGVNAHGVRNRTRLARQGVRHRRALLLFYLRRRALYGPKQNALPLAAGFGLSYAHAQGAPALFCPYATVSFVRRLLPSSVLVFFGGGNRFCVNLRRKRHRAAFRTRGPSSLRERLFGFAPWGREEGERDALLPFVRRAFALKKRLARFKRALARRGGFFALRRATRLHKTLKGKSAVSLLAQRRLFPAAAMKRKSTQQKKKCLSPAQFLFFLSRTFFIKRYDHHPFTPFPLLIRCRSARFAFWPFPRLLAQRNALPSALCGPAVPRAVRLLALRAGRALRPYALQFSAALFALAEGGARGLLSGSQGLVGARLSLLWACAQVLRSSDVRATTGASPKHDALALPSPDLSGKVVLSRNAHSVFLTVADAQGRVLFKTTAAAVLRAHRYAADDKPPLPPISFRYRRTTFRQTYRRLLRDSLKGKRSKQARRKQTHLFIRQTKGRRRKRYPQGRAVRVTKETMEPLFQVLERVLAVLRAPAALDGVLEIAGACFRLEAKLKKLRASLSPQEDPDVVTVATGRLQRRLTALAQRLSLFRAEARRHRGVWRRGFVWGARDRRPRPRALLGKRRSRLPVGTLFAKKPLCLALAKARPCKKTKRPFRSPRRLRDAKPPFFKRATALFLFLRRSRLRLGVGGLRSCFWSRANWHSALARQRLFATNGRGKNRRPLFVSALIKRRRALARYRRKRAKLDGFFLGPKYAYAMTVRGFDTQPVRRTLAFFLGRLLQALSRYERRIRLRCLRPLVRASFYRLAVGLFTSVSRSGCGSAMAVANGVLRTNSASA